MDADTAHGVVDVIAGLLVMALILVVVTWLAVTEVPQVARPGGKVPVSCRDVGAMVRAEPLPAAQCGQWFAGCTRVTAEQGQFFVHARQLPVRMPTERVYFCESGTVRWMRYAGADYALVGDQR